MGTDLRVVYFLVTKPPSNKFFIIVNQASLELICNSLCFPSGIYSFARISKKSNAVLSKTEVTDQMAADLVKLNAQYKTAVQATSDAQNKYNAGITDYISRTNSIINKNSNKTIMMPNN